MVMNMNKNQMQRVSDAMEIFKSSSALTVNSKRRLFKKHDKCALSFASNKGDELHNITEDIKLEMQKATSCSLSSARFTSSKYFLLLLIAGSQFLHDQRKALKG